MAELGGHHEGRDLLAVLRIDVGPGREEEAGDGAVAVDARVLQGDGAGPVPLVDVPAGGGHRRVALIYLPLMNN